MEEITERTMPVWLILRGVPRNFEIVQSITAKNAQKREQTQSASRRMFIIWDRERLKNFFANNSAMPEVVIATNACATVNHIEIMAKISPGIPKVLAKTFRLFEITGFAS